VINGISTCVTDTLSRIDSRELFYAPTPRLHGYDFAHQGLLGIWLGFQPSPKPQPAQPSTPQVVVLELSPSTPRKLPAELGGYPHSPLPKSRALSPSDDIHGDFHAAIVALRTRKGGGPPFWQPTVSTQKLEQRQFALQLCGWSLKEEDIHNAIKRSAQSPP
jgi:hypothetical protein